MTLRRAERGMVSVVIPAHNNASHLAAAVRSVLDQAERVGEIIVVDDGSSDGTADVAQALPGVTCVRQPNRGPSSARNAGVDRAQGEYVAFLDADDVWVSGKMAEQLRILDGHDDVGLVFGDMRRFRDDGWTEPSMFERTHLDPAYFGHEELLVDAVPKLLRLNPIATGTVVARRRALVEAGLFDEGLRHAEDWDLWLRVALRHAIGYSRAVCMLRRLHATNLSREAEAMAVAVLVVLEKLAAGYPIELAAAGADMVAVRRDGYRNLGYMYLRQLRLRPARQALVRSLRYGIRGRAVLYWLSTFLGEAVVESVIRRRATRC